MEMKSNRGVTKTKKALRNALAELLLKKEVNEISIKELTELANLNRGTFYFHYADIYDFVDKVGDEIVHESEILFKQMTPDQKDKGLAFLFEIFTEKILNAPAGAPLITKESSIIITKKISTTIRDNYLLEWLQDYTKNNNKEDLIFYSDFLISGYLTLLNQWINSENPMPKKEFIDKLERVAMNGIESLIK